MLRSLALGLAVSVAAAPALAPSPRVPQVLSLGGTASGVSIDSSGDLTAIAWTEAGSIWVSTSDGRGVEWSAPVAIDDGLGGQTERQSVRVEGGSIHVMWLTDRVRGNVSHDGGETWLGAKTTAPGLTPVRDWAFDVGAGGGPIVVVAVDNSGLTPPFLGRSTDGGQTFALEAFTPPPLGGLAVPHSVAIDVDGSTVHVAWNELFFGNYSYYQRSDDGGDTWLASDVFLPQASSDVPATLQVCAIASEGDRVALVQTVNTFDGCYRPRLGVSVSDDGGDTWTKPSVLAASSLLDRIELGDLALRGGQITVAWTDNRFVGPCPFFPGSGPQERTSVVATSSTGSAWTEVVVEDSGLDVDSPSLAVGPDGFGVVQFVDGTGATPVVRARWTSDAGSTWSAAVDVAPAGASTELAAVVDATYRNALTARVADGVQEVEVGGFRPQTLTPVGFVAGPTSASFELDGFGGAGPSPFGLVVLSLDVTSGSYLLPDGRDLGVAFDALTVVGLQKLQKFLTALSGGSGSTPTLPANLDAGLELHAVGVGIDPVLGVAAISDVVTIAL